MPAKLTHALTERIDPISPQRIGYRQSLSGLHRQQQRSKLPALWDGYGIKNGAHPRHVPTGRLGIARYSLALSTAALNDSMDFDKGRNSLRCRSPKPSFISVPIAFMDLCSPLPVRFIFPLRPVELPLALSCPNLHRRSECPRYFCYKLCR